MLTEAQKRELERLAAEQLRRNWGVVKERPLAAAIDDIRARFIEEGWYGRPLTELANDIQRPMARHELYGSLEAAEERLAEQSQPERQADVAER